MPFDIRQLAEPEQAGEVVAEQPLPVGGFAFAKNIDRVNEGRRLLLVVGVLGLARDVGIEEGEDRPVALTEGAGQPVGLRDHGADLLVLDGWRQISCADGGESIDLVDDDQQIGERAPVFVLRRTARQADRQSFRAQQTGPIVSQFRADRPGTADDAARRRDF